MSRPVIRRRVRSLIIGIIPPLAALPLSACGYFSGDWPALKQDPIPERAAEAPAGDDEAAAPPLPGGLAAGLEARPAITTMSEARARLADYDDSFARLQLQASDQAAELDTAPKTPAAWGQAQIDLSRLARTETDLRALRDAVDDDAAYLDSHADLAVAATDYRALATKIGAAVERLSAQRLSVQAILGGNRPPDVPEPQTPAAPLPDGSPALTITAEAESAAYSQAVSTLVEKAQAINSTNVYSVVAAADDAAAGRADAVRSLLEAGGVAETRIRLLTDPAAKAGSVRIYVE